MIFSYSESGTIELGDQTVDAKIDTASAEYTNRAAWIEGKTKTKYLGTEITGVRSPGDDTTNFTGTARFQLGDEPAVGVDAFNVRHSPHTAVAFIAGVYGLSVPPVNYEDPKPAAMPQVWEEPGARIGPPLPGKPGRFSSRNDGGKAGEIWGHPSGSYRLRYEVVAFGVGIWFWERV